MSSNSRIRCSRVEYHDQDGNGMTVLVEQVMNASYGNYVWPSSLVLSNYVWHHRKRFSDKTLLEVGAGTCLSSLALAKSQPPSHAHLIMSDLAPILPVVKGCLSLNKMDWSDHPVATSRHWVQELPWGDLDAVSAVTRDVEQLWQTKIDFILGSDTFYHPPDFEKLLMTISIVIQRHNPQCRFITAYQERSSKRSLQYLLDKWSLCCKQIPIDDMWFDDSLFFPDDDSTDQDAPADGGQIPSRLTTSYSSLSSVFLLEISAKPDQRA
ncbi:hypothetical protein DM01DRAFT_307571 [Hesseltinella vesiculosa]|uniref:Uncharacterized protein n=1 Tax=Hesseltinella vesiculosa TaxID=101127 RepID=A0A1X2G589_9FUNG|nr:hypothetical protein DM01DRAFT_307571 [Hesseltinella vesiculosa]